MEFQIDHIFIMVSKEAPEADQLIQFGLSEGKPNVHLGQVAISQKSYQLGNDYPAMIPTLAEY